MMKLNRIYNGFAAKVLFKTVNWMMGIVLYGHIHHLHPIAHIANRIHIESCIFGEAAGLLCTKVSYVCKDTPCP